MRRLLLVVALFVPSQLRAQSPARLALLDDWRHQRTHLLAVIDSATPTMMEFRTTKGVRTFAEQIDHTATVATAIVSLAVLDQPPPKSLAGDTAVYLHDRAKLRAQAEKQLDFVLAGLAAVTDDELGKEKAFAGGSMPKWRWNLTALQHSAWTLGQLVPYLRMNGRVPPQFTPF